MTHDEFISIVRSPELVRDDHVLEFKELVNLYPYFASARLFHVKALKQSNNIQFAANLKIAALYSSNRRWLYYYLYPDKLVSAEPYCRNRPGKSKSAGDYFDMINNVEAEGGDTKQSLKNLADRLKMARSIVVSSPVSTIRKSVANGEKIQILIPEVENCEITLKPNTNEVSYDIAKKLIMERKYPEAIEILRLLNLNNPKKSVYFADQIRFLEKIIANSKK
jgi:hypothetical protein